MLNRSNLFLAALLAVQAVLLAIVAFATAGSEARAVEPILSGIAVADVDRLTIADNLENEMIFARGEAGWVLPEADDFPLDSAKINDALDKLAAMDTRRLVASNPANFARLEVKEDDFRRRISLHVGESESELYLGGSGGANTVYARRAGEKDVYLASGLSSWELSTQVSTWLDADYVNVPGADVLEITVRREDGDFTFLREGEDWTYAGLSEGEVFEDTRMPLVLRNAATIRMQAPLGLAALDEYGLDDPPVTVNVRYRQLVESTEESADEAANGSTDEAPAPDDEASETPEYTEASYTLTFGAALEGGDIALKSSESQYYVRVRDSVLNAFTNLVHDELVKLPEAEADGGAPTGGE